jgi:hypothetical protein
VRGGSSMAEGRRFGQSSRLAASGGFPAHDGLPAQRSGPPTARRRAGDAVQLCRLKDGHLRMKRSRTTRSCCSSRSCCSLCAVIPR